MIKIIKVLLLCLSIPISVISSEWLANSKKIGIFLRMESGIESLRSDQRKFSSQAICGKWFNDYFNVDLGIEQSFGRLSKNSFTGMLLGTDVILFDTDRFTFNVNLESQIGSDEAAYFSPGMEIVYKIKSAVPMGLHFHLNEVLNKRDTSWSEDDTETTFIETNAPKYYSLQTELKLGYSRLIVQNQFLHFTFNPIIRHNAVQGEKVVDLGCIAVGHKFYLNRHLQLTSEFNIEIPQKSETTTLGFKFLLSTY